MFCAVFINLFVCLLFVFVFAFQLFLTTCWVMHQLYGLVLLEAGWEWLFLWSFVVVLVG